LGYDLAALWALDPERTQSLWEKPPSYVVDRGRLEEWTNLASGIAAARHLLGQIVLAQKESVRSVTPEELERLWLETFRQKAKKADVDDAIMVRRSETEAFLVYALVVPLMAQS
jgi:hypothetical protein